MLTREELDHYLHYCKDSGVFRWKEPECPRIKTGDIAGAKYKTAIKIMVKNRRYMASHLAWLYVYGKFPDKWIDHIDGNPHNNAISNLREATPAQNTYNRGIGSNNTSGAVGVTWNKLYKKWQVRVCVNNKSKSFGYYEDFDLAVEVRKKAAKELYGDFARSF